VRCASGTNRIQSVATNGTPSRAFTYDAAGNVKTDAKGGVATTYTYNDAGRMASLTVGSVGQGPYFYNGFAQLASR
jgi:YD repeat-containing protein